MTRNAMGEFESFETERPEKVGEVPAERAMD